MRYSTFAILSFTTLLLAAPAQSATTIADPVAFVKVMYATTVSKKPEPDDIYTDHLASLFALDSKEAGGEVGRIDFDFWMNGQDGDVKNVAISKVPVDNAPNRVVVIAKFKSLKTPEEIHFYFEKTAKGWKLDDARSALGEQWTLSLILKYGWDGKN
ncbi:MAG TPA: hypothetical protein VJ476_10850 [Rhizomicrobium sp.]|nr:hypothetical protein [Rhizomicrobium sp.]